MKRAASAGFWFVMALSHVACSGDDSPTDSAGSGGTSGTASGGTSGTASGGTSGTASGGTSGTASGGTSGTASGGTSGSAGATSCPPPDLGVRYVGRVDGCEPPGARYAWSGSGFIASFRGTGVSVRLSDTPNQHTVVLDGELLDTLQTTAGEVLYPLASDLAETDHVLEIYRRTEASFGETLLLSVEVEGGELLPAPSPPERRIEVLGDSISCGYGNEGSAPCSFSAETENHYLAYPSVLARSLKAELTTVAWSGKGVYYNYNGDRLSPFPTFYDRTVPYDRKNLWNFSWKPQAVVINLGTNDYSTGANPTDEQFIASYRSLLEQVRRAYPESFVLCTVGPMLSGAALTRARANIASAVAARVAAGDDSVRAYDMTTLNSSPGCDYHPSLATHAAIAEELAEQLAVELGW